MTAAALPILRAQVRLVDCVICNVALLIDQVMTSDSKITSAGILLISRGVEKNYGALGHSISSL